MLFTDGCYNTMSLHVRTVVWELPCSEMPVLLARAVIGQKCHCQAELEEAATIRLRQRSSHFTSLTASFGPFSLLESLYRPTIINPAALQSSRGVSIIFQTCRFSASLTGLDLHYASSGVYMQTSNQTVIRAQHLRARLSQGIESNATSTKSSCSFISTTQFCSR